MTIVTQPEPRKRGKYRNVPTEVDGIRFDSKKEANRYYFLKLLQEKGEIRELKLQPEWSLDAYGIHICKYRADFSYVQLTGCGNAKNVVEDVKGKKTDVYKLKKKLMKAIHGIEIKEI